MDFIGCVAEFGLILRNSIKGTASLKAVMNRLDDLSAYVADDDYKREFVTLVDRLAVISSNL